MCSALWRDASFKATGNLFFPDFWSTPASSQEQGLAYDMVGLEHKEAQVNVRPLAPGFCSHCVAYAVAAVRSKGWRMTWWDSSTRRHRSVCGQRQCLYKSEIIYCVHLLRLQQQSAGSGPLRRDTSQGSCCLTQSNMLTW
jgi:hypothetical protein